MNHPTRPHPRRASDRQGVSSTAPSVLAKITSRPSLLAIAAMAALTVGLFAGFIFSDAMLVCTDQLAGLDARALFRKVLLEQRQLPMWLPSRLGGMPTFDAMFGDNLYPPSMLIWAVMPVAKAVGMRMVLHVFLAGIFFFLLLRRGYKAPALAAFAGAVFYMFNPQFVSHVYPGHDGKMFVIAWLPFVMWRMKAMIEHATVRNMTLLALGIAMCLLTPHIQMTYYVLWGLFLIWCLAMVLLWLEKRRGAKLVPLASAFWGAVFLGLGLAFVVFLPPYLFTREAFSVRGVDRGFDFAASWSLHWPEVFSLWVPEFSGFLDTYWSENAFKLNTEYAGAVATLCAVLAVVLKPNPWRILYASIAVLAVLYGLGAHTPVFHLAYHLIPGVSKFRASAMILFWNSAAVALLAGLFMIDIQRGAVAELSEHKVRRWQRALIFAIVGITAVTLLFSARGFVYSFMRVLVPPLADPQKTRVFNLNFTESFLPGLWRWWLVASIVLIGFHGLLAKWIKPKPYIAVLLICALIDLFLTNNHFIQTTSAAPYFRSQPTLERLASEMNTAPFRVFPVPGALPQNGAGIHGLESCEGFHDNELRWYREFRGDQANRNYLQGLIDVKSNGQAFLRPEGVKEGNPFLSLANVRYTLVRQPSGLMAIENQSALGRLSFASSYRVMTESQIAKALKTGGYDYARTVALLEEPQEKPPLLLPSDNTTLPKFDVTWETYSVNYRKAEVVAERDGYMRISEVYYPAWEVRIDGKPADVYRADLAWMAVYLPKGKHTVEITPHSLYMGEAAAVSFLCWLLVFGYWIFAGWKSWRTSSKSSKSQLSISV